MAKVRQHYWQYLTTDEGLPISNAIVNVLGPTGLDMSILDVNGDIINPTGMVYTDNTGFFEFWVQSESDYSITPTTGIDYPFGTTGSITWYSDGIESGEIRDIVMTTTSVGPTGYQGDKGNQGPNGFRGHDGHVGYQPIYNGDAPTGPTGTDGAQGSKGDTGTTGNMGSQGPVGYSYGRIGDTGYQGNRGPQGVQGPTGPQGFQGVQGPQGYQGFRGNQGDRGSQGNRGDTISISNPNGTTYGNVVDPNGVIVATDEFMTWSDNDTFIISVTLTPCRAISNGRSSYSLRFNGVTIYTMQNMPSDTTDGASWYPDFGDGEGATSSLTYTLTMMYKYNCNLPYGTVCWIDVVFNGYTATVGSVPTNPPASEPYKRCNISAIQLVYS